MPRFTPTKQVLGSSLRWVAGGLWMRVRAAWVSVRHVGGSQRLGLTGPVSYRAVARAHQLALTASISLTKFWARQIPKICSNAMPMNMPATMVKLSCNHFSNWGTQPFV